MGHHLVILGGSYGGIAEMRRLSKYPKIQVTVMTGILTIFYRQYVMDFISSNTSFD